MEKNSSPDVDRVNAMLAELSSQRNSALDRCAQLAGELAAVKTALIVEIEKNKPEAPQ